MMKKQIAEIIKYAVYGAFTTAVNFFLFIVLNESGMYYIYANSYSYIVAVCVNYVLNRNYVFSNQQQVAKEIAAEFIKFVFVRLLSLAADNAFFYLLVDLCAYPVYPVRISLSLISIMATFFVNKIFVFKAHLHKKDE